MNTKDLTIGDCRVHARQSFADFIKSIKDSADDSIVKEACTMITKMLPLYNEFGRV